MPTDDFILGLYTKADDPALDPSDKAYANLFCTRSDWGGLSIRVTPEMNWNVVINEVSTLATFAVTPDAAQHIEVTRSAGLFSVRLNGSDLITPVAADFSGWLNPHIGITPGGWSSFRGYVGDITLFEMELPALTWNGGTSASPPTDGSGTWNSTNENWWDTAARTWANKSPAIFGAGNDVAGNVTVEGTVKPVSITFNAAGNGTYRLLQGTDGEINADNKVITITANVDAEIQTTLANGGLKKSGSGTLTLSGQNTYAGNTTISAGALKLGHSLALQNSTLDYAGAGGSIEFGLLTEATFGGLTGNKNLVLENNSSAPVALSVGQNNAGTEYTGNISGAGSLIKVGSGTLILNTNDYAGNTTLKDGIVLFRAESLGTTGKIIFEGGTLQYRDHNADFSDRINPVAGNQMAKIDTNGQDVSFGTGISGDGGLAKLGNGTLNLNVANTYMGGTSLNAGTIEIGDAASLGSGNVTFQGGILRFATGLATDISGQISTIAGGQFAKIDTNGNDVIFASPITGAGGLDKLGDGSLTLSHANTAIGPTMVSAGTLVLNAGMIVQLKVLSGGISNLNSPATATAVIVAGGQLALDSTAGTLSVGSGLVDTGAHAVVATASLAPASTVNTGVHTLLVTNSLAVTNPGVGPFTATYGGGSGGSGSFGVRGANLSAQIETLVLSGNKVTLAQENGTYTAGLQRGMFSNPGDIDLTTPNPNNLSSSLYPKLDSLPEFTTYVYTGQIFSGPEGTLNFGGQFDDVVAVKLNNEWVLNHGWWDGDKSSGVRTFEPNTWVDFEIRLLNQSAGGGPGGSYGGMNGVGYSWTYVGTDGNSSKYEQILDDGSMNLLRYGSTVPGAISSPTTAVDVTESTELALSDIGPARLGNLTLAAGTLTLSGAPSVSFATITATGTAAIGPEVPVSIRGGEVNVSDGETLTIGAVVRNGATPTALNKTGFGTLVLAAQNTYGGGTSVNAGILQIDGAVTGDSLHVNAGSIAGTGTIDTDLEYHSTDSSVFNGDITAGEVKLDKLQPTDPEVGTLTLGGNNNYDGGTIVNSGTLVIASAGALPAGKSLSIGSGGTLILGGGMAMGQAATAEPVPEPGTLALLAIAALAGVMIWRRK